MSYTTSKYGYYSRSKVSSLKKLSSVKVHTEERKYYIVITVFLTMVSILSVVASYLMPTVPL